MTEATLAKETKTSIDFWHAVRRRVRNIPLWVHYQRGIYTEILRGKDTPDV